VEIVAGGWEIMAESQPKFVHPGFKFVYDPDTDTVETHMAVKSADGTCRWEITHTTTASIFLQGEAEYRKCADAIRQHHARGVIAALPRGRIRKVAKG
jgi:hypothetical protein